MNNCCRMASTSIGSISTDRATSVHLQTWSVFFDIFSLFVYLFNHNYYSNRSIGVPGVSHSLKHLPFFFHSLVAWGSGKSCMEKCCPNLFCQGSSDSFGEQKHRRVRMKATGAVKISEMLNANIYNYVMCYSKYKLGPLQTLYNPFLIYAKSCQNWL